MQRGPSAGRAVDGDGTAECFDAVFKADKPGAAGGIGAAVTVVADAEVKHLAGCLGADMDG